jgi:hypothetical protein
MPTLPEVHRRGTRAAQPAASTVSVGALYYVTNEGRTERSNGTAWESVTDTAASLRVAPDGDAPLGPPLSEVLAEMQQQLTDLRERVFVLENRAISPADRRA